MTSHSLLSVAGILWFEESVALGIALTGWYLLAKRLVGCGWVPGRAQMQQVFGQHLPGQVLIYEDISPKQWRLQGSPGDSQGHVLRTRYQVQC